ncbi:MAG TPA: hypothetical protein VMT89_17515 [Candidatus Acidoferrales bacterium]|nr:hypothetical protein [Candidatus Acidoferrales bacterium]
MLRRVLVGLWLLAGIAKAQPTPSDVPSVELSSQQAVVGGTAVLGVRVHTAGASVGAVQVDLTFDSVNTPLLSISNGAPDCSISPELNEQFLAVFRPMGCADTACNMVRTFVFPSTFPIPAIPDGAMLYSCRFTVQPATPLGSYSVALSNLLIGDLNGDPLQATVAADGSIIVVEATPTATPSPSPTSTTTPTRTASPTPTIVPCVGDCNGDGEVTIDELILAVSITLGSGKPTPCLAADKNGDGDVTIDELIAAVNRALNGC